MLPWADMVQAAARLGICPGRFWQLSLREWRFLSGQGGQTLPRRAFDQLMRLHPDKER